MKKLMVFLLSSIFLFFLVFINLISAIRINEVELNPEGTDTGNEWIEIYSENEVNLTGWILENSDNKNITLNQSFQGYLVINFTTQWLDNVNESVSLFNGSFLVSSTSILEDSSNDNRTWQYCNGSWIFFNSTKGAENLCYSQNNSQNLSQNQSQENNSTQELSIYLKLDWDENDIINGKKFEIEVKAFNLKNENYDIKIYIKPEDEETVLSEVYDEKEDKWLSGNYYIDEIISGSGEKDETFLLRIKSKYSNFSGDAEIVAKIRKSGTSSVIDEAKEDIEVLKKEENNENTAKQSESSEVKTNANENATNTSSITSQVIKLGNRQSKEEILYESKNEKIKKYSIYGLNLVLIIIVIFLITNKKVLKPER